MSSVFQRVLESIASSVSDRAAGNAAGRVRSSSPRARPFWRRIPRVPPHAHELFLPTKSSRARRGPRAALPQKGRARGGGRARFSVEPETLACVRGTHARVPDPNGQHVRVRVSGKLRPRLSMTINRATTLDKVKHQPGTILSDCRRAVVG